MSQVIYDNILISLYLLVWIITFVWYQWRSNTMDAGSAIILSYIAYAVFSILTLNDPLFSSAYDPLRFFPFFYLYGMLLIALSPVIYDHLHPCKHIESPNTSTLTLISILAFLCAIAQIPEIVSNFGTGFVKLFTDMDAGKDAYMEQIEEAEDAGGGISNLPAIIYNCVSEIAVFLLFYFLTLEKKNIWIILMLIVSMVINILQPIMLGQRSGIILSVLTIIGAYMLFRRYIARRINHTIQIVGLSAILAIAIPVAAITVSRFGNMGGGVVGFLNWYIGQANLYFNNHALNAGGTRNGDRTLNLAKRIINPDTPKNYTERRDLYHNLEIDDNTFSTFVGDFVIDYGPVAAVVIFVVFNFIVVWLIRRKGDTIKLHQMLLLFFTVCICIQGGMYLFAYSDTGNLRIITLFLFYIYLRYHEVLMKYFPLKSSDNNTPSQI